jgi:hypothetical protein
VWCIGPIIASSSIYLHFKKGGTTRKIKGQRRDLAYRIFEFIYDLETTVKEATWLG